MARRSMWAAASARGLAASVTGALLVACAGAGQNFRSPDADAAATARTALLGLPLATLDACAAAPGTAVDEPKFSRRRYVTPLDGRRDATGPACVLEVEARDGVIDRVGIELVPPGARPTAGSTCIAPVARCLAGTHRSSAAGRDDFVPVPALAQWRMDADDVRPMRVGLPATPMAPTSPPLVRAASAGPEVEHARPQPECIRVSTRPGASDEPGVAEHLNFRNVCPTRISLWHCDQRGCPRMTAHAFVEPGATARYVARKEANPATGGGDYVACPSPKADYVRREGDWVCTRAP